MSEQSARGKPQALQDHPLLTGDERFRAFVSASADVVYSMLPCRSASYSSTRTSKSAKQTPLPDRCVLPRD